MMIYVVRGENSCCPESYTFGAFSTEELAQQKIDSLIENEEDYEFMWFDEIELDNNDVYLSNR